VLSIPNEGYSVPLPEAPTRRQSALLSQAYQIAQQDGLRIPQLLQGILIQESKAGGMESYKVAGQEQGLPTNLRYYGVCQVKLAAAHDVLRQHPEMWTKFGFHTHTDEEVIAKLIDDDTFNLSVASKYLLILNQYGYHTAAALAVAYNRGPGGARGVDVHTDSYAGGVVQHIREVTPKPARGSAYTVRPGDSLSKIAADCGIAMDVILELNPQAFVRGDPNMLLSGVDLVIPTLAWTWEHRRA
jgi:LysM repeat protein